MQGGSHNLGFIRGVAECGDLVENAQPDHAAPVLYAQMSLKGPQSVPDRIAVAQQRAEQPLRGQCDALPDKEPEMGAMRAIGRQSDEAADRGERDERRAAIDDLRIEAGFDDEATELGAEFGENDLDRPDVVDVDKPRRRRFRGRMDALGQGCLRQAEAAAQRGGWGHDLILRRQLIGAANACLIEQDTGTSSDLVSGASELFWGESRIWPWGSDHCSMRIDLERPLAKDPNAAMRNLSR